MEKLVENAVIEYWLEHPTDGDAERRGRRAAVRGLMVRMQCYTQFCLALNNHARAREIAAAERDTTHGIEN